jgi:hypothetical protein
MASTDAKPMPKKNVAFRLGCDLRLNTGALNASAAGLDSEVSKDGAAYADCTNEWTEIGTSGTGYLDLTSTEMNADKVMVKITSTTTDSVPRTLTIYPVENGDIDVNATQIGGQTASASGTVTFPNATLASTTNITAGTLTTVTTATNVTTVNGLAAGVITAASIASDAITDAKVASDVTIASVTGAVGSVTGSVGGNVTGSVGSIATGGIVAASFAADAITAAKIAADVGTEIGTAVWATTTRQLTGTQTFNMTGNITGNLSGSVGSVTAMVTANSIQISGDTDTADRIENVMTGVGGTITADLDGSVLGNVSGSVGSVTVIATNAITAASLNADAATEIATAVWASGTRTITGGTVGTITGLTIANVENASTRFLTMIELDTDVYRYTTNALEQGAAGSAPTVAQIVAGVWDEPTTGNTTSGTFGAAVVAAGSAGDPWSTAQPGAYAAGTFGYLVSTTYTNLLTGLSITVSSPITADGGTITVRRGDDYLLAIGTQIPLVFTGLPYSLVGATMVLKRPNTDTWACVITGATTAYIERTNVQTTELIPNQAGETVEFNATLSGGQKVTPATATLVIQTEV